MTSTPSDIQVELAAVFQRHSATGKVVPQEALEEFAVAVAGILATCEDRFNRAAWLAAFIVQVSDYLDAIEEVRGGPQN